MKRVWSVVAVGVALAACEKDVEPVTVAPRHDTALSTFVADRKEAARKLEADGRPVQALREWRYIAAAAPRDEEARARIAELTELIETRKAGHFRDGEAALAKGQTRQAQLAFLKVLALDESDERARDRLREIDRTIALANQGKKDERAMAEYRATVVRKQDTIEEFEAKVNAPLKQRDYRKVIDIADQFLKHSPDNKAAAHYRKTAYLGLVEESRRRGNFDEALRHLDIVETMAAPAEKPALAERRATLRKELAGQLYSQGLGLMTSDVDKAIELLARAVENDPDHLRARSSLLQARKMRETLNRIGKPGG
jgi:tetratricopeptide (TPR) repeat protein